ncbi:MAG: SMC-Scp complex subunit ScpB [Rhodospirillaceae bacterium]|nr:MAG: SMC-Scp complex subunit ScpB [Rhodospirillaceae bacterium]
MTTGLNQPSQDDGNETTIGLNPHLRILEAVLFAVAEPLDNKTLAQQLPNDVDLPSLLETLRRAYANRGVTLVQVGGKWAFRTAPDLAGMLRIEKEVKRRLSRAAKEMLAIVAYHAPITRAEIEEIRGVALSRGTLDQLLEAEWIRPMGRRQTPGRPMTWGVTDDFYSHFGLSGHDDLPGIEELKAAGLLDQRPAISIYADRAGEESLLPDEDAEMSDEDADGEENAVLAPLEVEEDPSAP